MAVEVDNRTSQHPDEDALAALVDRVLDAQGATRRARSRSSSSTPSRCAR